MRPEGYGPEIRFAAFLISGSLFLAFGIETLTDGITEYVVQCTNSGFPQDCSGISVLGIASPIVSGSVTVLLGIVLYAFAYRAYRSTLPDPAPSAGLPP
jgi:hypothetical protein